MLRSQFEKCILTSLVWLQESLNEWVEVEQKQLKSENKKFNRTVIKDVQRM